MERSKFQIRKLLVGGLIAAIALGTMAFAITAKVQAADDGTEPTDTTVPGGPRGMRGNPGEDQKYLSEALGITEDELTAAQQTANEAAIQAAVEQGLITQEQADEMLNSDRGFRGFHFGGRGGPGDDNAENTIDYDTYLATTLGISVDELKSAREEARELMLAAAVENGDITQEQLDLMQIQQALAGYLDRNALQAEALGITTDEFQAYREEGKNMEEILAAVDMTSEEYQAALQAAYEAAIAKAVSDGVITQEQADSYLTNCQGMPGGMGFGHGKGGPGMLPDQSESGTPPAQGPGGPGGPGGGPGGFGRPGGDNGTPPAPPTTESSDGNS